MSTRYKTSGDEFEANCLFPEGRHHLSTLKNMMNFQGIDQQQRSVVYEDGTVIKCVSCFGQDVIDIFVPPGRGVEEPEYIERLERTYFPAFEAYESADYDAEFLGIVLCKGGGFEPPYVFIDKKHLLDEKLPEDWGDRPCEKLRKERSWEFFAGEQFGREERGGTEYLDIAPSGLAGVDVSEATASVTTDDTDLTHEIVKRTCEETIDCAPGVPSIGKYNGVGVRWRASRIDAFDTTYCFSFYLEGEASQGSWPDYEHEGHTHSGNAKPSTHILDVDDSFYYSSAGNATNCFAYCAPFYSDSCRACVFIVDFILFGIPYGHWEATGDCTPSLIDYPPDTINSAYSAIETMFEIRSNFYQGDFDYTRHTSQHSIFAGFGSAMAEDRYAIVYSLNDSSWNLKDYRDWSCSDNCFVPCSSPDDDCPMDEPTQERVNNPSEGPLLLRVDDEEFVVATGTEASRLQDYNVKYFDFDNKFAIALYCVAHNYNYPLSYKYIYTKVTKDENGEVKDSEMIITEIDEKNHLIPGVKGQDDCDLYGHWNFRLVREEIRTVEEE